MLKIKNYIILCALLAGSLSLAAQRSSVRATIEPSDIYIGEQAVITLEVISPLGRNVQFPVYTDTLIAGIEVLKMDKIDTLTNEVSTLTQRYLITSFDSLLYHIPFMPVIIDGNDTLRSNSMGFKVMLPELFDDTKQYLEAMKSGQVDSISFEALHLADIKPLQKAPFVWLDYATYVLIPLAILLLLAGAAIAYYLWRKKRNKGYFFTPKVVLPPHVVALNDLDSLKAKKLSQIGLEKEYYTELTTIIREYICKRFPTINAPEMITNDILDAVHKATEAKSPEEGLQQMLELADLVKFAKHQPFADENDLSLVNAYLFVNQTKQVETQTVDKDGKPIVPAQATHAGKQDENKTNS